MSRTQRCMRLKFRIRKGRSGSADAGPPVLDDGAGPDDHAGRVRSDLSDELPEEDLAEDLTDALDLYEMGSKPRCEEAEYLDLVEDALDRIARGERP